MSVLTDITMQSTDSFCLEDVSENVTVVNTLPEDEVVAKFGEVVEEAHPVMLLSDALDDTKGGGEKRRATLTAFLTSSSNSSEGKSRPHTLRDTSSIS